MQFSLSRSLCLFVFFFFSSRRRHTRWNCDWSSDVCSSDLGRVVVMRRERRQEIESRDPQRMDHRMGAAGDHDRSEEHTSELQSQFHLVCRLLLEKKKKRCARARSTPSSTRCTLCSITS